MTTITPISSLAVAAMPGGGDLSAEASAPPQGKNSFLGLFAALLNTATPDTDLSSNLIADLATKPQIELASEIMGNEGRFLLEGLGYEGRLLEDLRREDVFLSAEELAHLFLQEDQADDEDDITEENTIVLGMLSTPVEAGNTAPSGVAELAGGQKNPALPSSPSLAAAKAEGEESSSPAKQGSAAAEKALPPAANLAAKSDSHSSAAKEEKHDFSNFLREASALNQGRAANHDASRVTASLPQPVASSAWGERLGEQIVWMTRNGLQQVDLKLNPANLGPLSISLNMEGNRASIHFTVASMEVRQAIEDAMPRLRKMMAANGVSLGDADVDEQARRDAEAQQMASGREHKESHLPGQNGEFAENSEGGADASGKLGINMERESILPGMAHAAPFAYSNGRIGGIDLFA